MDKRDFIEMWAPLAMEHQVRYGIPASVTLAQAAIESGWGSSELYTKQNACFGVKLGNKEGQEGKDYVVREDDRKDDKFRIYESRAASFEDHSRLLVQGTPYRKLSSLSATDYKGWAQGLEACKYATKPGYGGEIKKIIEKNKLTQYDKQATEMAAQRGVTCGYAKVEAGKFVTMVNGNSEAKQLGYIEGNWHMPLAGDMVLTSEFGNRTAPTKGASTNHKGVDIQAQVGTSLFSTEDNGKVIKVANDSKAGNYLTIKYDRADGKSYEVTCMHLDSISVKQGDTVKAGQIIGKTGATGNITGPHLHFQVEENGKIIDPKSYLAEIAVRGNLDTTLKKGSEDVLLAHKREFQLTQSENDNLLAENDKKKNNDLLSQLGTGIGGGDFVSAMFEILIKKIIDLKALEELYLAEKQKENKTTEISENDMSKYRSEGVDLKEATRLASSSYESIITQESQSQSQRKGIV